MLGITPVTPHQKAVVQDLDMFLDKLVNKEMEALDATHKETGRQVLAVQDKAGVQISENRDKALVELDKTEDKVVALKRDIIGSLRTTAMQSAQKQLRAEVPELEEE